MPFPVRAAAHIRRRSRDRARGAEPDVCGPEPEPVTEPAAGEHEHQAEAEPDPESHPLDEQVAQVRETLDKLKAQQATRKVNADYHARVERKREAGQRARPGRRQPERSCNACTRSVTEQVYQLLGHPADLAAVPVRPGNHPVAETGHFRLQQEVRDGGHARALAR
jgi:hypothetical protein